MRDLASPKPAVAGMPAHHSLPSSTVYEQLSNYSQVSSVTSSSTTLPQPTPAPSWSSSSSPPMSLNLTKEQSQTIQLAILIIAHFLILSLRVI